MIIGLRDKEFAHIDSYCGYDKPKNIIWDRESEDDKNKITVFTERMFQEVGICKSKIKIAWLLEPEVIHNYGYKFIRDGGYKLFDYVFTFDKNILDAIPNGVWWTPGGSWFVEKEWQIYPILQKTKKVSIIASDKTYAIGHKLRHEVIEKYRDKIDYVCGKGYDPVENKIVAFKDFLYTIVIENCKIDYYWTDKILDAFAAGVVPIFWGCPSINNYFDGNGIISFDNINELDNILDSIGLDDYDNRSKAIKNNFRIAKKYKVVEDYMYESFFRKFDNV